MPMEEMFELRQVRVQLREAETVYSTDQISSPEDAGRVMSDTLAMMDREYCCVVNLDNHNRPINFNVVSIGDVNSAIVPIQNIFKAAILSNAHAIMLFHNHPSSQLSPSREDEILTEKLIYAGKIMNINVIDHVIVGGNEGKHYSFRENEGFLFEAEPGMDLGLVLDSVSRQAQLKEITDRLETGISEVFTSSSFQKLLTVMGKFHNYSFNNNLLISLQKPDASLVAGYTAWQKKFHRHVNRGEKAIKIIAPMTFQREVETEKLDPVTQEVILGPDGQPEKETKQVSYQRFKVCNVFDYKQTSGDPLPFLEVPELTGEQENYDVFMDSIKSISPVPISFDDIPGEAKGYYSNASKEIVIQKGMSDTQTIKTAIHEVGHALCHDKDVLQTSGEKKDRVTKELEAESIAFCVASYFNIDVSDYSFPYIAGWAADRPRNVLQESMDLIRTTSGKIIDEMLEVFKERGLYLEEKLEEDLSISKGNGDTYEIFQIDPAGKAADRMFMDMAYLEKKGFDILPEDYTHVYQGELSPDLNLEKIYEMFNLHHPEDFQGHSLSVGDVVSICQSGKSHSYFVDSVGFKEIPDFQEKLDRQRSMNQTQKILEGHAKEENQEKKVRKEAVPFI